ncbi:unnamed protein product [Durusdinium trenchii]|uniref:rRNA methyltransferase 1, mitochondrial n=2 Tax=Durusdinium trenchii TaxID=1381693 RepID=A0ABP0LQ71_9DINO
MFPPDVVAFLAGPVLLPRAPVRTAHGSGSDSDSQYGRSDYLYGVYPVLLALRAQKRKFKRLWVLRSSGGPSTLEKKDYKARLEILQRSEALGIPTVMDIPKKSILDHYSGGRPHQGLVLKCSLPFVQKLQGITDPMNLGSLLRSAAFFGVEGVICEHGCAKYSAVAAKASAGAGEMVQLLRVSKLQSLLPRAKEQGWCVVGAALPDPEIDVDFSTLDEWLPQCDQLEGVLLLLGPEGPGLRRRLKQLCDRLVGISRVGDSGDGLDSLNAGVAAGVLLHGVRQALGPPRPAPAKV